MRRVKKPSPAPPHICHTGIPCRSDPNPLPQVGMTAKLGGISSVDVTVKLANELLGHAGVSRRNGMRYQGMQVTTST